MKEKREEEKREEKKRREEKRPVPETLPFLPLRFLFRFHLPAPAIFVSRRSAAIFLRPANLRQRPRGNRIVGKRTINHSFFLPITFFPI